MKDLPKVVQSNIRFLKSKNIWFNLSTNKHIVSCLDAAANRIRLGHRGIPIFDELKTELGYFINNKKEIQKILVHCRGNQKLDRLKISGFLNSEYHRLENKQDIKGLVNPFNLQYRNLLQIFDTSTLKKIHPPFTMMTNAGDFNYAVEFDPVELIRCLNNVRIENIIRINNYNDYVKHKIGILTGNGPDSGILLWKRINESVRNLLTDKVKHSFRGDLSYPEIFIESIPEMGISMELGNRLELTKKIVIKSIMNLCNNGATLICIACNTTQFFKNQIEEICQLYGAKFIALSDVLEIYLQNNKINNFDFIGISYVTDFNNFSAYKKLKDKYVVNLPNKSTISEIRNLAYIAKKSPYNYNKVRPLKTILEEKTEYDNIVIALTEISIVLDYHRKLLKKKTIIDTLQILADKVANIYIEGIFNTLYVDESKDNFVYYKLRKRVNKEIKNQIWRTLIEIDYEFIPPLSYRDSTTFSFEKETINMKVPEKYFRDLLKQKIIVCELKSNSNIVGIISYIPNYILSKKGMDLECYYVTTLGVTRGVRGNGIARQLYKMIEIEALKSKSCQIVATRTWSTNKTHINILKSFGYKKIIERKNDRGSGIHTVYYSKQLGES